MSDTLQKILHESINLSVLERIQLVDELYKSFEIEQELAFTQLWIREAESRLEAFERGEIEAEDYETIKMHLQ